MGAYKHDGSIDCQVQIDVSKLDGKTAIVTGGANGIGEVYVKVLHAVGCQVVIGDLDVDKGQQLQAKLPGIKFVKCDTTKWEDQLNLFREAASWASDGRISHVVANAGIARKDDVFQYDGDEVEPRKPGLSVINVNINGSLYTAKLASHYFIKQNGQIPSSSQQDTCLVLIGSGAAFLDVPRGPQYAASKWAMRGIMHSLRRTTYYYGSRVNVISPWYVRTNILSEEAFQHVSDVGVEFAKAEDAGQCLLRILSDSTINGHSFFISARKWAPSGFVDLDIDDYPGSDLLQEMQRDQMLSGPVDAGLFLK
ncbi:Carbonyl reductase family member 4 [Elsinoe australis]|uniref:Carbonyl reductase family member 4 n=1 Tax=Elsinoe australis TaxID=40998 RepID=A0A2P8A6I1_9PEZI|nr:Carbonyl reductase family member 4 [Elsinoe australis]